MTKDKLKCPYCEPERWSLLEERLDTHEDEETGAYYDIPVRYLKCLDCGETYTDDPFPDENIQDEIDRRGYY